MSNNESFEVAYSNIDDHEDLNNLAIQLGDKKSLQEKIRDDSQIKKMLLLSNKTTLIVVASNGFLYKFSFSLEGVSYQGSLQTKEKEFANEMIEIEHIMELSNGKLSACSETNNIFICKISPFQLEHTLSDHNQTVYSLCELSNAKYLVSGSQDSYVFIWNNYKKVKEIGGYKNKTLIPSPIVHLASTRNFVVNWRQTSTETAENSYLEFYDYAGEAVRRMEKIFTGNQGKMFEIKEKDHLVVVYDDEKPFGREKSLIIVDYINFKKVAKVPVENRGDDYCFDIYLDSLLFLSGTGQLLQLNMYNNYQLQTEIKLEGSVGKFLYAIEDKQVIVVDNEIKSTITRGGKQTRILRGGLTSYTFQSTFRQQKEVQSKKRICQMPQRPIKMPPVLRRIVNQKRHVNIAVKHFNLKTPIVLLSNHTIVIGTKDGNLEFYSLKSLNANPRFQREINMEVTSWFEREVRKAIVSIVEISNNRIVVISEVTDFFFVIDFIGKKIVQRVEARHRDVVLTAISLQNGFLITTAFDNTVIIREPTFKIIRELTGGDQFCIAVPYATAAMDDCFLVCWKLHTKHILRKYTYKGNQICEAQGNFTNEQGGLFYLKELKHIVVAYQDESENENKNNCISILNDKLEPLVTLKHELLTNYPPYSFDFFSDSLFYANNSCLIQMNCSNKYEIIKTFIIEDQFDGDLLEFIRYDDICYIICDNITIEEQFKRHKSIELVNKGLSLFRAYFN